MKVVIISQDFYPKVGGIATHLDLFIERYLFDCEVHVILPYDFSSIDYSKKNYFPYFVNFFPFDFNSINRDLTNGVILSLLNDIHPDTIIFGYIRSHPEIGQFYKDKHPFVKLFLIAHAKEVFFNEILITNVSGGHKGYTKSEIDFYKKTINSFDYILPVSTFTRYLLQSKGIKTKMTVVNPSIKEPVSLKSSKELSLLSVGRLIDRKGQLDVISLMPRLLEKYPALKYYVVGSGPNLDKIRERITELNLENNVLVLTNVPDNKLSEYYSKSSLFVLPTKHLDDLDVEGFGIVFLEAGSHGLPVIGGRTGGVVDAIKDGKTGFLINPIDLDELFSKIDLLLKDIELRNKLGFNGYENSKSYFSSKKSNKIKNLIMGDM